VLNCSALFVRLRFLQCDAGTDFRPTSCARLSCGLTSILSGSLFSHFFCHRCSILELVFETGALLTVVVNFRISIWIIARHSFRWLSLGIFFNPFRLGFSSVRGVLLAILFWIVMRLSLSFCTTFGADVFFAEAFPQTSLRF